MAEKKRVQCPHCRTAQDYREGRHVQYVCKLCKGIFDNNPDEGGDFADHRPDIRLEREDRARERRRNRVEPKRYGRLH